MLKIDTCSNKINDQQIDHIEQNLLKNSNGIIWASQWTINVTSRYESNFFFFIKCKSTSCTTNILSICIYFKNYGPVGLRLL